VGAGGVCAASIGKSAVLNTPNLTFAASTQWTPLREWAREWMEAAARVAATQLKRCLSIELIDAAENG
jgi:hypothetical protein